MYAPPGARLPRRLIVGLLALACALCLAPAALAATVTNGSFESDFTGWTKSDTGTGSWLVNASGAASGNALAPSDGLRDVFTQQGGAGSHLLYQDIVLEPNHAHQLTFDAGWRNNGGSFTTPESLDQNTGPNQQFRVDIVRPTASLRSVAASNVLAKVMRTEVGSPLVKSMTSYSADLSALAGQTVRLRFAEVDNQGTFNVSLDRVRITSTPLDSTPPVITPTVTGTMGANGWHTSDVAVSWSVSDAESAVSSKTGCADASVTSDTDGTTFTCSAASAGGSSSKSVTIKRDATKPTITASRTPANANGWNNGDVTASFACADEGGSGIESCTEDKTLSDGGADQVAHGEAVDKAGNEAEAIVSGVNIDKTKPFVEVGGGGSYTVADTIAITCSATDALSRVDSDTCGDVAGSTPVYEYALGTTTVGASAVDKAGNQAEDSADVTVQVTPSSLCELTRQFVQGSDRYAALSERLRNGIDQRATALCAHMDAIVEGIKPPKKAAIVLVYKVGVRALAHGEWLTADQTAVLTRLAGEL